MARNYHESSRTQASCNRIAEARLQLPHSIPTGPYSGVQAEETAISTSSVVRSEILLPRMLRRGCAINFEKSNKLILLFVLALDLLLEGFILGVGVVVYPEESQHSYFLSCPSSVQHF